MVKLNFEYIIIDENIVKINGNVKKDESTTTKEYLLAEVIKTYCLNIMEKEGFNKNKDVQNILNNIGK